MKMTFQQLTSFLKLADLLTNDNLKLKPEVVAFGQTIKQFAKNKFQNNRVRKLFSREANITVKIISEEETATND